MLSWILRKIWPAKREPLFPMLGVKVTLTESDRRRDPAYIGLKARSGLYTYVARKGEYNVSIISSTTGSMATSMGRYLFSSIDDAVKYGRHITRYCDNFSGSTDKVEIHILTKVKCGCCGRENTEIVYSEPVTEFLTWSSVDREYEHVKEGVRTKVSQEWVNEFQKVDPVKETSEGNIPTL